jgi:oligopeptidase A
MNATVTCELLNFDDLPLFDKITPEQIEPAIDSLIKSARQALETVCAPNFAADWNTIASVLDVNTEKLSRAWSAVNHLSSVADNPKLRSAYNNALPMVTQFWTDLGSNEKLYALYKSIDPKSLNPAQSEAHKKALRGFVLSGAELSEDQKVRFGEIQSRLSELSQKFSENVLDATDQWSYLATESEMQGVPEDVKASALAAAKAVAQARSNEPGETTELESNHYLLTLKMPCYFPVMQYAHSRTLRETMYRAYVTRASEQGNVQFDNTTIIQEILSLRAEEAKMLGFKNFAELSLATKMADSPKQVIDFLYTLAQKAKPYAEKDVLELRAFAGEKLGLDNPNSWDWTYVSEKLKEERYAFSEQELKEYFPAPRVLSGLFKIVENLFEVNISKDQAPTWHPSVEFYKIERDGHLVGQFYLDPGARTGKRGGAWMDDVRARWLRPDNQQLQTPVAHLVCNFSEGVNGAPALLTHDDVITLFHEFGHGLHHMLTQINERDVSGISGVEWDAVELPSQFMENFCWDWSVLQNLSEHSITHEPLPRSLYDKMIAAKNFQSGMQTLRQVEFALFDMKLHCEQEQTQGFMSILNQIKEEIAVLPTPAWSRPAHSFSHIFAGGYAAGYYSYKWAEVLSADAYAAFEESALPSGEPNIETGRKYRINILEVGGSRSAIESFKAFRGREPSLDALLRHQGMTDESVAVHV